MTDVNAQLLQALENGDLAAVKTALKNGADPAVRDVEGLAVNTAITNGQTEIVAALLDAGLSPNAGAESNEMQPLLVASYGESENAVEIVDLLITAGANVNAVWYEGVTALITAIESADNSKVVLDVIDHLISAGADLEQPREDGFNPLQLAASNKTTDAARKLLDAGANIQSTRVNHPDVDSISIAEFKGNAEMIALFKAAGARDLSVSNNDKINGIWNRIIAAFSTVPEIADAMTKATSTEDIVLGEIEIAINGPLSAEVAAQWQRMGGGCDFGIWEYELLSAQRSCDRLIALGELSDENNWENLEPRELDLSRREISPQWWNRGWIPIAEDGGGNLICIDHAPDVMGARGQVIFWEVHSGPVGPIASSWFEYLETYAAKVESGGWTYDDGGLFEN